MRGRRGFTLLELMVAIALISMLGLIAGSALRSTAAAASTIILARERRDRDAAAARTLRQMIESIDVGTAGSRPFAGFADSLRCSVWQAVPGGWSERRQLIIRREHGSIEAVTEDLRQTIRQDPALLRLAYLPSVDSSAAWVDEWSSPVSAPFAIRMILGTGVALSTDTLYFVLGSRG